MKNRIKKTMNDQYSQKTDDISRQEIVVVQNDGQKDASGHEGVFLTEQIIDQEKSNDKKPCRFGKWSKLWAILTMVICSILIAASFIASIYMNERGYYSKAFHQILDEDFSRYAREEAAYFLDNFLENNTVVSDYHCGIGNIAYADTYRKYSRKEAWSYGDINALDYSIYVYRYETQIDKSTYVCDIALGYDLQRNDTYRSIYLIRNILYTLRYAIYFISFGALIVWIFLYVFLLRYAGYSKNSSEPKHIFESYIPFEISLSMIIAAFCLGIMAVGYVISSDIDDLILSAGILVALEIIFILWSVCFAIRIKTGYIWKTMLLRYVIIGFGKFFRLTGRAFKTLVLKMPLIWQTVLGGVTVSILILIGAGMAAGFEIRDEENAFGWMLLIVCLLIAMIFIIYISIVYRELERKTDGLAEGDLSGKTDTRYMLPLFKKHAMNLEKISGGIVISNEKRNASEKTQAALITNVSHDIKTPLTSIINYADLITKENCENEKINEYAQVLGRQSTRLKRLLEDLIEVSKAQSGALEVSLQPCEVSTLINQASGEFEEKLKANELELITKGTGSDIRIMADPRRMWRVFDNLLGNICKYAMHGTRVYMDIEESEGRCRIIFKNTSARELNMTPEELMERFVRGDRSREGAEGNGLGLSIALNLVQLQKGSMDIVIDGDLFKVILEFPCIQDEAKGQ